MQLRANENTPNDKNTAIRPRPRATAPLSAREMAGEKRAKNPPMEANAKREIPAKSRSTITVAVTVDSGAPVALAIQ